ncbi:MAG: glycerol kinase GlpK [Actinomycetota bacterium]
MLLSLDQGTTSSRAILFADDGSLMNSVHREFTQHYPADAWVEHDPNDLWDSQLNAAQAVISQAHINPADIRAIGITNQRETTVVWNRRTGEPIHRAIVWQDRRTARAINDLKEQGLGEIFQRKTGLILDPYFSGSKVRWLLDHVNGAREQAENGELAFGTVDSWLLYRLTGGRIHATDVSNASRTLLFDIHRLDWDDELLTLMGVPRSLLPEVRSSSEVYGETDKNIFGRTIPIAGIAGDQHAATFGQACFIPGQAKNTYGTGCFLMLNTGLTAVASQHHLVSTPAWQTTHTTYALEGSIFMAGAIVQWLRDGLGLITNAAQVEQLAASVPDHGGVYVVPAFTGLGAPHWDPYARGTITGLTRGSTSAHIARAALDAITYQVHDVVQAMESDCGSKLSELRVDGGASSNDLLMQGQADILGIPVVRPQITETTALGAAYLAGLAVGVYPDHHVLAQQWQAERVFEPRMPAAVREHRLHGWNRSVERARAWAEEDS